MWKFAVSVVLYVLSCIAIIAIFVTIFLMTCSSREMPRRLAGHVKPCPFGKGTDFKVSQIIESPSQVQDPEVLFSLVLFGKPSSLEFKTRYVDGLARLMYKKKTLWPKAQVRLYVSENVLPVVSDMMLEHGANLHVVTPGPQGFEATLWRFWAFDDATVPVVSFDADDDLFSESYVQFLKDWIQSDKLFFIKSQFWSSVSRQKISACRFGCKPGAFKKLLGPKFSVEASTKTYCDTSFGCDESYANFQLYPVMKDHIYWSKPCWTEYMWIPIGIGFFTAIGVNMFLVSQGLKRISEADKKQKISNSTTETSIDLMT